MADTLLLDQTNWDLCLDTSGNIALASPPYAVAQDVASAIRTFQGEVWYNTALGIPYFAQVLGQGPNQLPPPPQLLKQVFVAAAFTVPDVVTAVCFLSAVSNRELDGQVQITDSSGTASVVSIAPAPAPNLFILGQSSLGGTDVI